MESKIDKKMKRLIELGEKLKQEKLVETTLCPICLEEMKID